ncbi:MAG: hypothetical protein FJW23_08565, partial [Acidimicrobiia bacterium]|nr:hypothetical protein [Acidimicrobiia bacterium]
MRQWWRSRSLRLRLALWHTCALVAVLAVYAGSIYVVVRTNLSTALNDRLRGDFQWAAEMSEQQSDGTLSWFEGDTGDGVNDSPWLQVWGADDGALIYRSPLARRLPMPESTTLVEQPATTLRTLPTPVGRFRLLSAPSRIGERRVTIQVARSEEPGWGELRDVLVILALAL